MAVVFHLLRIILYLAKIGFSCYGKPLVGDKSLVDKSVNPWYYLLLTILRFYSRTYDSFFLSCLPISKSWGIIILANANVQNKQLGAGNLLTTDMLVKVRIASVVGGFHLATQEKVIVMADDTYWLVLVCISGVIAGYLLARYHDRRKR